VAIIAQDVIDEVRPACRRRLAVPRRMVADEPGTLGWRYSGRTEPLLGVYELDTKRDALSTSRPDQS